MIRSGGESILIFVVGCGSRSHSTLNDVNMDEPCLGVCVCVRRVVWLVLLVFVVVDIFC